MLLRAAIYITYAAPIRLYSYYMLSKGAIVVYVGFAVFIGLIVYTVLFSGGVSPI